MNNNIHVVATDDSASVNVFQHDKGQYLLFASPIPDGTECQFPEETRIVENNKVRIPDALIEEAGIIKAYLQIISSADETTVQEILINVKARDAKSEEVSPEEQPTFREWIEGRINAIYEFVCEKLAEIKAVADSVRRDANEGKFNGKDGADGNDGKDGSSPSVSIEPIENGNRVTITDETGAHTADILNGEKGDKGDAGGVEKASESEIDDRADVPKAITPSNLLYSVQSACDELGIGGGGGSEEPFEEVARVETTAITAWIPINKDSDGNIFNFKEAVVFFRSKTKADRPTEIVFYLSNGSSLRARATVNENSKYMYAYAERHMGFLEIYAVEYPIISGGLHTVTRTTLANPLFLGDNDVRITQIAVSGVGGTYDINSRVVVYGR